jgi:hypothetical protein
MQPRGTPLEYWFVKTVSGDLAFLVDWILRRASGTAEVRVSLWVRGHGRVLHRHSADWLATTAAVDIAGCTLRSSRATGAVEDVSWDLNCAPGPWLFEPAPRPARLLHPFDLELCARPRTRFTGTVVVAGETFRLDDAAGTVVHYWGRRLPDSWVWVSADGVGDDGAVVEAAVFRSRLWGRSGTGLMAGYVVVDSSDARRQVVAPAYGRVTVRGSATAFTIDAAMVGRSLRLSARAPLDAYNDLGEGIHQTLLGELSVDGLGSCRGRAGLEVRGDLVPRA